MKVALLAFSLVVITRVLATPSLKLTVSGSEKIIDIDNLVINTTLTNIGSESVKLLRDPQSILSQWRTNKFTFSGAQGTPLFTGIMLKYSPESALRYDNESNFVVLTPGKSFKISHHLAGAYDFTRSGPGKYEYIDKSGKLSAITAATHSRNLNVTGKLFASKSIEHQQGGLVARAIGYVGCSSAQQTQIATAATTANSYVDESIRYLAGISSGTPRYTTWFGPFTSSGFTIVKSIYAKIGTDATSTTYDCTCTDPSVYAYVYPSTAGRMYLCGAFWSASNSGHDSRAGIIIHEQSHFTVNGGTNDSPYGQFDPKSFAALPIMSADSYQYFAENTPPLP
ncbi:peptidyl-Lys metalloendopeptidase [Ceratobasidium sp. AG-Ba]|nr:peptidyl-Lys metalloendopeptidase [Ceratobasidium sp. AG-Ba]QRW02356.1 peptidyl-Lys metalloendopeptidase [Ceratobasidium sp. AG-Ba]